MPLCGLLDDTLAAELSGSEFEIEKQHVCNIVLRRLATDEGSPPRHTREDRAVT